MSFKNIILLILVFLHPATMLAQDIDLDSLIAVPEKQTSEHGKLESYFRIMQELQYHDIELARECAEKEISLAQKLNEPYYEAIGYRILAIAAEYDDELDSALNYNFSSLNILEKLMETNSADSIKKARAKNFNAIGSNFANMGNLSESVEYFHKALTDIDSAYLSTIYNNVALVYSNCAVWKSAIEYSQKAMAMALRRKDSSAIANSELQIAHFYLNSYLEYDNHYKLLGAINIADKYYNDEKEYPIFITLTKYNVLTMVYIYGAKYYSQKGFADTKNEYLRKAEDCISKALDYDIELFYDELLANKVKLLCMRKKYKDARILLASIENPADYYEAAKDYYEAIGDYKNKLDALEKLEILEKKDYSLESTVKSTNYFAKTAYDNWVEGRIKEEKARQTFYKHRNERAQIRNWLLSIASVIGLAVLSYIIRQRVHISRLNKQLADQNTRIEEQNKELINNGNEMLKQTDEISKQSDIIKSHRDNVKRANDKLLQSIVYASRIQQATVPSAESLKKIYEKIFVLWRPLDVVSGDFYWANEIDGKKYIIAADCTGHGVPGALLSILGISMLNDLAAQKTGISNSAEFLSAFKDKFVSCIGNDILDGMDLALIVLDGVNKKIQYTGAKRPILRIRDGEITEYKPDKICIGNNLFQEHVKFTFTEIDTMPGDMFYAFSDGLQDQFGGPEGNKLKMAGLKQLLKSVAPKPLENQKEEIMAFMIDWITESIECEQIDDELIIGIRI